MFEFRLNLTIEVDQVGNGLAIQQPVPIQLHYRGGRWAVECEDPPLVTPPCDRMDEAVVAGARAVALELQAAVDHRPLIIGRITPEDVPAGWF
ncbi:MAG TPA: hypothetical protein PKG54_08075 [Phycisphaerae bacterium]|jgi:hypothetical protein|nr:hypothetical protein [Phycisphaerae bacterium]HOB74468.1 hypothetical protein [Phycisphaerae bacterium]HOJ54296.1 hypothetical protein [Phycisphaerae bacterium]HOL26767.1 hypothetical protein [Phycisphaerae bacterium]HPP20653.1 hypothetical protein [Phycisphaerae bacterium]